MDHQRVIRLEKKGTIWATENRLERICLRALTHLTVIIILVQNKNPGGRIWGSNSFFSLLVDVLSFFHYIHIIITCGGARGVCGGARGVMVIVVGNGHGDTSSNPGRDWLHFT